MITVQELDLEISFAGATAVINFDDAQYHTPNTIKRVDFIAEYHNRDIFVEIKDLDIPNPQNIEGFLTKLGSGVLVQNLAGKFRDTVFFRTAQGISDRSIVYVVLLSMQSLDVALLLNKQDQLKRSIPIRHSDWSRDCATSCVILNLEQWKRKFGAQTVRRISEEPDVGHLEA